MKILENTTHCPDCGGCGVVFDPETCMIGGCSTCRKFKDDAEACYAAEELVKMVWGNNARAMRIGGTKFTTVGTCGECPMFKRLPEEYDSGMYDFCGMEEENIEFSFPEWAETARWKNCPLKKLDMHIRSVHSPDRYSKLPIAEVDVCVPKFLVEEELSVRKECINPDALFAMKLNHDGRLLCLCPECDKEHEKPVDPDPTV